MSSKGRNVPVPIRIGQVVTSKAGRDSGKFYVVTDVLDDRFVLVADGEARRLNNPKKKNKRHLLFHDTIIDEVAEGMANRRRINDKRLKELLDGVRNTLASEKQALAKESSDGIEAPPGDISKPTRASRKAINSENCEEYLRERRADADKCQNRT
ncbi:MAG TPA: hypothetical protein GX507_07710 [Clostridia bacterium]|nr:hypothetical protein [Clostridia bacterium]